MGQERFDRSELRWTDSDYLCLFCYDPLYHSEQEQKEICANPTCITYPTNLEILSYRPEAREPILEEFNAAVSKCYMFPKQFFYKRLSETRAQACHNLFTNGSLDLKRLLGVNYLLVSLDSRASWGNSRDISQCCAIILECLESYDKLNQLELVELKNVILTQNHGPYIIKYNEVIADIRRNLGLVNLNRHGSDYINSFDFIDRQAAGRNPEGLYDFEAIFQNSYPLAITISHLFKLGYFVSEIHRYPAKTSDWVMLVTLWAKCRPGKPNTMDYDELKQTYNRAMTAAAVPGNFNEFLGNYSSGEEYAPIIINDGFLYHFDYATLLVAIFYIISLNRAIEGPQTQSGREVLNAQRATSAKNFEKEIRRKFKKENYVVFPANDDERFEPSFDGQRHEYDCIAIDKNSKRIILIDAKYMNISPSSTVGETIVEQVALDKRDGLLLYCKDQHEKRRFFIKHCSKMPFGIEQVCNYKIISLVVTKYAPLIKRHLTTSIMSYDEFKDYDFKTT